MAHQPRKRRNARLWTSGQFELRSNRPACRGQRCALPTAPASAHLPTASHHDDQERTQSKDQRLKIDDTRGSHEPAGDAAWAAQAEGSHRLAGRLLRLPHVLPRHRRAAGGTARAGRVRPLAADRHQALRPVRHRPDRGRAVQRGQRACAARVPRPLQDTDRGRRLRDQRRACPRCATISTCGDAGEVYRTGRAVGRQRVPNDPELPLLLDKVHPIHEVVHIDYFLPGCPPSADAFWAFLTDLLAAARRAWATTCIHYD